MNTDNLRDINAAELHSSFSLHDIEDINQFQIEPIDGRGDDPLARILNERLFPKEVIDRRGRDVLMGTLACNTALYDDHIEDAIDDDNLVEMLQKAKEADPTNSPLYTQALRIRRSVIAFMQTLPENCINIETIAVMTPANTNSPSSAA